MMKLSRIPETISYDGAELAAHAERVCGDKELLATLKNKAENYLKKDSADVTKRRIKADNGDPHEYASMGPYWWPNPNTENGLPYVRRDGEVNPEIKEPNGFGEVFNSVKILTLAAYYFDEPKYAEKAVKNIRAWYLDPETAMNPRLEYAQFIPGICKGRGIGIIDSHGSQELFDSVALLYAMDMMPESDVLALKEWYNKLTDWMLTSENGIDEDRQHNNHGTWYDVQIASAALFTGRKILAERTLTLAYERRILKHIAADGKQPYELARTHAIGYSTMNLKALMLIAKLAKKAGCKRDMWHEVRVDGSIALKSALDYLAQYATDLTGFEYQEIGGKPNTAGCAELLTRAAGEYPEEGYLERARELYTSNMLFRLLPI